MSETKHKRTSTVTMLCNEALHYAQTHKGQRHLLAAIDEARKSQNKLVGMLNDAATMLPKLTGDNLNAYCATFAVLARNAVDNA